MYYVVIIIIIAKKDMFWNILHFRELLTEESRIDFLGCYAAGN